MKTTNPIVPDFKNNPDARVAILEAASNHLKHYKMLLGAVYCSSRELPGIKSRDGVSKEEHIRTAGMDIESPLGLDDVQVGLAHALERARKDQTRLRSQRQKRAETKARVGELEAQLRGLKL